MTFPRTLGALTLLACAPHSSTAQSVVVDEGTFEVKIEGQRVGEERFSIRRAGPGGEATFIANAVIDLATGDGATELQPLLEALLPEGAASKYQLKVTGAEAVDLTLSLAGRRFISRIRTPEGEEEREFLARPETRILERGVAHHYYFLRNAQGGSTTPAIEPRTRTQLQLTAGAWTDEELVLGPSRVPARKVTFTAAGDARTVWFDRQGRVLRVEIPASGYVAVRTDLVG